MFYFASFSLFCFLFFIVFLLLLHLMANKVVCDERLSRPGCL